MVIETVILGDFFKDYKSSIAHWTSQKQSHPLF